MQESKRFDTRRSGGRGVRCNADFAAVQGLYERRNAEIENVLLAVEREARLIEDSLLWRDRRIEAEVQQAQVENQIFMVQPFLWWRPTCSVICPSMPRLWPKREFYPAGGQPGSGRLVDGQPEMSFRTDDAGNTITFLRLLENSEPRLRVRDFSLSRSRNQYNGSITVVGFAENTSREAAMTGNRTVATIAEAVTEAPFR